MGVGIALGLSCWSMVCARGVGVIRPSGGSGKPARATRGQPGAPLAGPVALAASCGLSERRWPVCRRTGRRVDTPLDRSIPQPRQRLGDAATWSVRKLEDTHNGGAPTAGGPDPAFRWSVRRSPRPWLRNSRSPAFGLTRAPTAATSRPHERTATPPEGTSLLVVRGWDVMVGSSQPERSGGWGIALPAKRSSTAVDQACSCVVGGSA